MFNGNLCPYCNKRLELGLGPSHSIVKSPDGKHDGHMTIGNMKR